MIIQFWFCYTFKFKLFELYFAVSP